MIYVIPTRDGEIMKTVKVRIAVTVGPSGNWYAIGWQSANEDNLMDMATTGVDPGEARYWLTAELPIPEIQTIEAEVSEAEH